MSSPSNQPYEFLDDPDISNRIFHPRGNYPMRGGQGNREDFLIPVDAKVNIGASFHTAHKSGPTILFFHGNGEIVSDYDDFAVFYTSMGINLLVVDYRGYGNSTGTPCASAMMRDCIVIFDHVKNLLAGSGYTGSMIVMGRSLGSASAIELAVKRKDEFSALIIESGFAYAGALLEKLGIRIEHTGFTEISGFGNLDKISRFTAPCLIIHAQFDHIIPFSDGQALFDACPSENKTLLKIDGANHNDIFMRGMDPYLKHVRTICFQ